jgi:hypothetical protein
MGRAEDRYRWLSGNALLSVTVLAQIIACPPSVCNGLTAITGAQPVCSSRAKIAIGSARIGCSREVAVGSQWIDIDRPKIIVGCEQVSYGRKIIRCRVAVCDSQRADRCRPLHILANNSLPFSNLTLFNKPINSPNLLELTYTSRSIKASRSPGKKSNGGISGKQ